MTNRTMQTAARILMLGLAYFITGRLVLLPASGSHITLVWLPAGLAVAALLRWGPACWPGVTLGAIAAGFSTGMALEPNLGIAAGNTAGPLLAAWLLRRIGFHPAFDRKRDIVLLATAGALGMLICATVRVAMLGSVAALPDDRLTAWLFWWAGDTMGVIAVAPLLLASTRDEWRSVAVRRGEFLSWLCTVALVMFWVFFLSRDRDGRAWTPGFVSLPIVAWAALRFGAIGTSLAVIVISVGAAYATVTGRGPLHRPDAHEEVLLLWLFMVTSAVLGWLISALQAAKTKATGFQHLLEGALRDVSLGVLLGDLDRKITYANAGFTRLTGYREADLLGKVGFIHPGPETNPATMEKVGAALNGDGCFEGEILDYRKDGTSFWNALLITPVHNDHGEKTGLLAIQRDVSERRQAELARNDSVKLARSLIDSMQDGFVVLNPDGLQTNANPAFCKMTGFSKEELIGQRPPYPYWPPEGQERMQAALSAMMRGDFKPFEGTFMRKNGEHFPAIFTPSGVSNREGRFVNFLATVQDITERKREEEVRMLADQKLRLHFDRTPIGVIEWDLEFRVTRWNPAAEKIFGYTAQEAAGQHASLIVPEKLRDYVDAIWQALLARSGGGRSPNENITKDGRTIFCEWFNTQLIDERGKVVGVASLVMDLTERKQAQRMLTWEKSALEMISTEASLHDVLDGLMRGLEDQLPSALCSILLLDDDGIHLRHGAAPSLAEAYVRAIDGVAIGPTVGSCGTAAYEEEQVIVADTESHRLWEDYRGLAREHGLRACWSTPIRGDHGTVLGTFAIYYREPREPVPAELELIARVAHITRIAIERKRAEAATRESEEKFHAIFENASDAIFLLQGERFIDCNIRTLEMFGCQTRDQIVGHPPYEFSPPLQPDGRDSRESALEKIEAALGGRRLSFERTHRKLDGSTFPAEVSLNAVEIQGGKFLQAFVRDISRRKRAEEQIQALNADLERRVEERTSDLLSANRELESFSYSVSHDLRTPLRAVDGFSRILAKNYAESFDDEGRRLLGHIRSGAQRMGQLIDDLLAFSKLGRLPLAPSTIDMGSMAQGVFDELAGLESGRKLHLDLHPLPAAQGTLSMVRQVWVNLIGNAIKFTKERAVGEIEIGARSGGDGTPIYYVRDNGAGFDMRYAAKLFGVFQRLHAMTEFEGTGVGLALVQRIVQRHGGRIWAEAELQRGATFSFTLPSTPE